MALTKCSECGREVSDKATSCPGCGAPITPVIAASPGRTQEALGPETTLLTEHRAIFREKPMVLVILVLLGAAVAGGGILSGMTGGSLAMLVGAAIVIEVIILLAMMITSRTEELTVTNKRLIYRKGLFSKSTSEVLHHHIRNIQITQSFFGRIMKVGTLAISSAGQSDFEIIFRGIRDPQLVKETI